MTKAISNLLKKFANMESKIVIKNESSEAAAKIYIYGPIGGWFSETSARDIRRRINAIDSDEIHVHINSPGGDVFDGVAIHNLLKNHKAKIVVHVDGLAASAASIIAVAGDEVIMPANTMMMIHHASTIAFGNAKEFRKTAEDLDKVDAGPVKQSYLSRFVGEEEELIKLLDEESMLTAEECLALGFADKVTDEIEIEEPEEEENAKEDIVAKYAAKMKKDPVPSQSEQNKSILNRLKRPS